MKRPLAAQFIIVLQMFCLFSHRAAAEDIHVYRQLKFLKTDRPDFLFSDDPMLGRLTCPPLIQYNLLSKSFSSLAFSAIRFDESLKTWKLTLSKNLRWWDQKPVSASEMAFFLRETLNREWASKLGIKASKVEVQTSGDFDVEVKWKEGPFFGPYTLSGYPLSRLKDKMFECAGEYAIVSQSSDKSIELKKVQDDRKRRFDRVFLHNTQPVTLDVSGAWFKIFQLELDPERKACQRTVDYSIFTVIDWNLKRKPLDDLAIRNLLDEVVPRHHITEHLMTGQADVVSGPFIGVHPGNNRKFTISAGESKIKLKELWPRGRSLKLCFSSQQNLLADVLAAAYRSQGVETEILNELSPDCDGHVRALQTIWPTYNNILEWVSNPNWLTHAESMSKLASNYLKTLSFGKPEFQYLQQIHELLYTKKLSSVVMQHKACIEAGNGFKKQLPPLIMRNLSWFEDLLK